MKIQKIYSLVRSFSQTSMPVNDLVPHMNTAENYSYSKVIFCIRGVLASKKIQRVETANGSKVAIKELGMLNMTFIIVSVGSFTNRRRKTIFHVHNPIIGYIAIFAKLNKNVRVVTNLHNDWKNFSIYQKIGLIFSFYASSKIIAVSDYIHSTLPKILRYDSANNYQIYISLLVMSRALLK